MPDRSLRNQIMYFERLIGCQSVAAQKVMSSAWIIKRDPRNSRYSVEVDLASMQEAAFVEKRQIERIWKADIGEAGQRLATGIEHPVNLRNRHHNRALCLRIKLQVLNLVLKAWVRPLLIKNLKIVDHDDLAAIRRPDATYDMVRTNRVGCVDHGVPSIRYLKSEILKVSDNINRCVVQRKKVPSPPDCLRAGDQFKTKKGFALSWSRPKQDNFPGSDGRKDPVCRASKGRI